MSTWSARRKYGSLLALVIALVLVAGALFFTLFYKAPTCSDGIMNGDEHGVDCGGKCARLCPADFAAPRVEWSYSVRVVPGVYNSLAYVENPNPAVAASGLPYVFKLYDDKGVLVAERVGKAFAPAGQKFAVFEGGIQTGQRLPFRTTFEFTGEPQWQASAHLSSVKVLSIDVTGGANPRAEAVLKNDSTAAQAPLDAVIILYDADGNRISFSKTATAALAPGESVALTYTWPEALSKEAVKKEIVLMPRQAR
jgi:hypothetical protein